MTPPTPPSPSPAPTGPRVPLWRRLTASDWFKIIGIGWVVILLGSLTYGVLRPTPTDREQTTVAAARPFVDEAIARVAAAVAAEGSAVQAVSGFVSAGPCEVTVLRGGERYQRVLVAVVPPGTEADLLQRVAQRLPPGYRAAVRGGDAPRLSADVGLWVQLTANVDPPGEIRFVADTGDCRARGDLATGDPTPAVPTDTVPDVLARLNLTGGAPVTASVSCVDGGTVGTVETRAPVYGGDLAQALADLPGATVVVGERSVFAYRTANAEVAIRAHPDATIVTATVVCGEG